MNIPNILDLLNTISTAASDAKALAVEKKATPGPQLIDMYPIASAFDDPAGVLDRMGFQAVPVAVVPLNGMFTPLADNKHRFLLAADGLYLELRRPWLHFIHKLTGRSSVAMPFGQIAPRTDLKFGRLGCAIDLMRAFVRDATAVLPNEHVRHIVWDDEINQLVPINLKIESASPSSVQYRAPALPDHQSLAIDLHSHGEIPAFFSDQDNMDDAGSVKFAGVIGELHTEKPTLEFRICVLGLYIAVPVPADKLFGA